MLVFLNNKTWSFACLQKEAKEAKKWKKEKKVKTHTTQGVLHVSKLTVYRQKWQKAKAYALKICEMKYMFGVLPKWFGKVKECH